MKSIDEVFPDMKKTTDNFEKINRDILRNRPEILKIIRLSLGMSIHEFSNVFKMHNESRYERRISKPSDRKVVGFMEIFREYRNHRNMNLRFIKETDNTFGEKHKGGISVGLRTLFRKNDPQTIKLSRYGARMGGLRTVQKYGKIHMTELSRKINKGRDKNSGFRSKAEMLVGETLRTLGIDFNYEKVVEGFLPDFLIGDDTIVEVMCFSTKEYWEKQAAKIQKLSRKYKMLIATNNLPFFKNNSIGCVRVIEFSKHPNVLQKRICDELEFLSGRDPAR